MPFNRLMQRERVRHGLIALLCSLWAWPAVLAQGAAGKEIWQRLDALPQNHAVADIQIQPEKFGVFHVDGAALAQALSNVPKEFTALASSAPGEISLPMPDGSFARFKITESPVLAPELAAQFPEIKTYAGQGIDDPHATVRFDWTPAGFHAQILSPRGAVYIDPHLRGNATLHVSYFKRDYRRVADGFICLTAAEELAANRAAAADAVSITSAGTLRTYRLACAATGEYTQFHGGTVAAGLAAIATAINRINQIYEAELAIRLVLVANNNLIVYTNPASDPYSNLDGTAMLAENQSNLDLVIGSAGYDMGHVFSTGGGGIATRGCVCGSTVKARGVTGLSNPIGDPFWIDFVAHEMGHQFGANHTFNSSLGNCAGANRFASTAYEPGSGSTIMAYAGICSTDDLQPHSDPYFHFISLQEINAYITTGGGSGCPVATANMNLAPIVNAGPGFTIPVGTPFTLTATGSDANGDALTYCWEERDLGVTQTVSDPDNGSSPLFRSFPPVASPARTFPKLSDVLNNTTSLGEKLPSTTRTMNFRVTARDNRAGGGGFTTADMQVIANAAAGPFLVTAPNTAGTRSGVQTVTWNVAGTTNAPVNAAFVNILLSTNGGATFSLMLRTNVPNTGSATVVLPNINTAVARVKVEGAGNIFFDVSNVNFTIVPAPPQSLVALDGATVAGENCVPANGALDPDETVTVNLALRNFGSGSTTNLVATLLSTGGVIAPSGPQTYGALTALGPAVIRPFTFIAAGTCGSAVTATLQLQDGSTNLGTVSAVFTLGVPATVMATRANTNRITIPASGTRGVASPYPSSITVSNIAGVITKVTVTLVNLAHTTADDIDVLLVSPTGQRVIVLSDAGGTTTAITNVTLTFDDAASFTVPDSISLVSGTFKPGNFGSGDTFTGPAPAGPYSAALSAFNGFNPNGAWSLYIEDDATGDIGAVVGGWQLSLTTSNLVCCNSTDLAIGISDAPDPVALGSNLTYTITVTNRGPSPATGVVVSDTLPVGMNFISATASQGSCTNNGGAITCQLGSMTGGAGASVIVTALAAAPGLFTNTATVASSPADAIATNNTARAVTTVTAPPANSSPAFVPLPPQTVNELATLTLTNQATDANALDVLTFGLVDAPVGVTLNATNGVLTWMPAEGQGPATHTIVVRVFDNGAPSLSATQSIVVFVLEVNQPPALAPVPSRTIHQGTTLVLTNIALDPDLPANALTYSLSNAPVGASVGAANGVFTWTPDETRVNTTNSMVLRVMDNGVPNLGDARPFQVRVVSRPVLGPILLTGTNVTITWSAVLGNRYRVQHKPELEPGAWNDVSGDVTATSSTASQTDATGLTGQRFYRVLVLP